ncbi:MAG: chromosome segregation protein SMC [Acidimicrobiales bacterium]
MFLKRLTMKGFKSFADTTDLEFEPGVTAVVGPNGSGKSNVVDAVTWVLGAQSTRALRSSRMDDVIFMGTPTRPPLGRAEVSLTIDNSSGKLPVDGAEVTITRTLFRNGESEYAINGTTCRLLDVQELLGDSGVGRQQHMIIGQGQLDAILNASSDSRRAVIEEAAGVLKHRRRKERAERRLEATQENLQRLGDLVREVRRQIRPLERQAASARHYGDVEAELRAARHALFAERLATFEARRVALEHGLATAHSRERTLRDEVITLDSQAATAAAHLASRREEVLASALGTLQVLAERARGTASLIEERDRSLRAALIASADENVIATLEADAARVGVELTALAGGEAALAEELVGLDAARADLVAADAAYQDAWGGAADDVAGALTHRHERLALIERSLDSLREAERRAAQRLRVARESRDALGQRRAELREAGEGAAAAMAHAHAERDRTTAEATSAEIAGAQAEEAWREAADRSARAHARAEALARALEELSGAGGRAILRGRDGVLGAFLDLVDVDAGAERAVESAAGAAAGAMVVDGRPQTRAALEALRREGGAGLILPVAEGEVAAVDPPAGTVALRSMVRARRGAPAHVTRVLDALFSRAFVAEGFDSGIEVAVAHPDLVIVTRDGDQFSSSGWRVASGRALVTRVTVDEAALGAAAAAAELEPATARRDAAARASREARERATRAATGAATAEADVERLAAESARVEAESLVAEAAVDQLAREGADVAGQCVTLEEELTSLRAGVADLEASVSTAGERRELAAAARAGLDARRAEVAERGAAWSRHEAQLAEGRRLLERRRAEIEDRLEGRTVERDTAAQRRRALESDLAVLARLDAVVRRAADDVRLAQDSMDSSYREQLEVSRAGAERLEEIRRARRATEERLAEVADATRRDEIEHAELAVMTSNLVEVVRHDLGVEPSSLAQGPVEVPDGVSLDQHVGELEARMTSLGPINPWALEELAALEERYRDLDVQVGDVRHARRELLEAIRRLDDEIMATFAEAYVDVNEHFSHLIEMLFPGGQGRLTLTAPEDPLNTGVEIEVRPMGRNIRRISLLSGGERSMVTLAFLFAVFRSRPSPFYMMDEVEAALDDVNLQRFLSLVREFREEAQLLIVTHQKRTMEAADALYGVTMVPGGSSKVVSQRVNRPTEVPA